MVECPECGASVRGRQCGKCGWSPGSTVVNKCRVCNQGEAQKIYAGKCSDCGRCHGKTERGRCTFRAEVWDGGRAGYCGWHRRVKHDDRFNTFEEFEKWQALLLEARICDRWTHHLPGDLWDGMAGAGERKAIQLFWCGGGDCAGAPVPPDITGWGLIPGGRTEPAPRAITEQQEPRDATWRDKVLEQARRLRGA